MNKYVFEFQLINIGQFCTIPLPEGVYSRLNRKNSFQVFQIFKKSHAFGESLSIQCQTHFKAL